MQNYDSHDTNSKHNNNGLEENAKEDEKDTEKGEENAEINCNMDEKTVDPNDGGNLTPYEQLRQKNIKERENFMRAAGVLPVR